MKQNGRRDEPPLGADPLQELGSVAPGDVVDVFMENTYLVKTIFDCREVIDDQTTEWRWLFLDDGSLIEVSPDGYFRYTRFELLKQGTSQYEELVAQDGALVRFEQRVQTGDSGRRPVLVTLDGKEYRISSTGTVAAQRQGEPPAQMPWQSFSPDPKENVYFGLVASEDESEIGLGLWTTHVSIAFGRPLESKDLTGVYRK